MSARGRSTPTSKERSRVIDETLQRFPTLPTLTLARHLLYNYGYLFEYNLETVRHSIRYRLGKEGDTHRKRLTHILQRDNVIMPQTWRTERTSYNLPAGLWLILPDVHVPFHEPIQLFLYGG